MIYLNFFKTFGLYFLMIQQGYSFNDTLSGQSNNTASIEDLSQQSNQISRISRYFEESDGDEINRNLESKPNAFAFIAGASLLIVAVAGVFIICKFNNQFLENKI